MKLCVTYPIYQKIKEVFQPNDELKNLTTIYLPYNADRQIMDHIQREKLSVCVISISLTFLIDNKMVFEFLGEQLLRKLEQFNCQNVLLRIKEKSKLKRDHISLIQRLAKYLYKRRKTLQIEMNHSVIEMKQLMSEDADVYFQLCLRTDSYFLKQEHEKSIIFKDIQPYFSKEMILILQNLNNLNLKALSKGSTVFYVTEECKEKKLLEWISMNMVQDSCSIRKGGIRI